MVRRFRVTHSHCARGGDGRLFHHAKYFQREIEHVVAFSTWTISQSSCWRIRPIRNSRNWPPFPRKPPSPSATPPRPSRAPPPRPACSSIGGVRPAVPRSLHHVPPT